MSLKVIAFDVFGTVFDFKDIDKDELRAYVNHVRQPEWKPLNLPKSWEQMPAHPDSAEGITELRKNYIVCTMSNGPLGLLAKMSKNAGITWDAIIPLEMKKVYKPNPSAYMTICEVFDVKPEEVMMVTANEGAGDLEAAKDLGMETALIRHNRPSDVYVTAHAIDIIILSILLSK